MEQWKPIKNFENYEVSTQGRVRNRKTGRFLKQNLKTKRSCHGYCLIRLYNGASKSRCTGIHRLVAEAFIPNPNNYPQINHKDENSLNNNVENLEWCTAKYNSNYGTIKERQRKRMLENNPWKGKHHSQETIEMLRQKKLGVPSKRRIPIIIDGVKYESITKAMEELGLCTRAIYRKINKEKKEHV